jgi:hypothetical protein
MRHADFREALGTDFSESRKVEVRRITLLRTPVNRPGRQALSVACGVVRALLGGASFLRRFGPHNGTNLLQ